MGSSRVSLAFTAVVALQCCVLSTFAEDRKHYDAENTTLPDIDNDENARKSLNCNACMVVVDELQMSIQHEATKRSTSGEATLTAQEGLATLEALCAAEQLEAYGLQYIDPFTASTRYSDQTGKGWPRLLRLPWIEQYLRAVCADMVKEYGYDIMFHMQKKYALDFLQDTLCGPGALGLCTEGVTKEMYADLRSSSQVMEPTEHHRVETAEIEHPAETADIEDSPTVTPHTEL